jgi:hypothetical protein
VNEDVLPALFGLDKSVPFLVIKPFHSTLRHDRPPPFLT